MENPPHSQLSPTFKSEGTIFFVDDHWNEHNAFNSAEKSMEKLHSKKTPKLVVEFFWLYLPGIQILWSELHPIVLRLYMSATLVLSLFWPSSGMKRRRLWIRERTFGAVNKRAVVLGYSTVNGRGCWPRKLIRGHLFSSPKQKAPAAFAQLATS